MQKLVRCNNWEGRGGLSKSGSFTQYGINKQKQKVRVYGGTICWRLRELNLPRVLFLAHPYEILNFVA